MFIQLVLHKIHAIKISDHPFDPFNRRSELYQTWQLAALEEIEPGKESARWARQGFSTRGAPDDGSSFAKGEARDVVDPQISLGLPDLKEGEVVRYRFDVHYWESDTATEKVRGVFSDATLEYMTKAWKAAGEDEAKARKSLGEWLDKNWEGVAKGMITAASPTAAGVLAAYNVLPLLEQLFVFVRSSADDYHQMHRFVLEVRRRDGAYHFQVTSPSSGASGWFQPGKIGLREPVSDATGDNAYVTEWRFRLID